MPRGMSKSCRRSFIRSGVAALAGACVLPPKLLANKEQKSGSGQQRQLLYRTLGRTGLRIPIVSLGCGFVDAPPLIHAAWESGITHFDTAPGYGGGKSETVLGETLKGKRRKDYVLASKIGLPQDNLTGRLSAGLTGQQLKAYFQMRLEERLKLLQTDYLDILYLYDVARPETIADPLVKEVLSEAKLSGKVRFVGASFHQNEPAMIRACVEQKIYDVVLTAYNFRQPHWAETKKAIAEAAASGLGVVAMKFMAGTYWDRERRNPINARAALKWVLLDPHVHTVIAGIKSFDQVDKNMSVMSDLSLTDQERTDLRLGDTVGLSGLYCSQCRQCREQCPKSLQIPAAMRSYMYAYGYRESLLAKRTLAPFPKAQLDCRDCPRCRVSCPQGFDVGAKMRDIFRLRSIPDEFLA